MSEPIEWIYQAGTGCAYCKDGLCQRMNQLMEDGYSQRKAAKVMEEEAEGQWKAGNIRQLFINWTGKDFYQKQKRREVVPEEKTFSLDFGWMEASESFCRAFEKFYYEVQVAKKEKWKHTSKKTAAECAKLINDLIEF